jgi:hypothetical protein
VTDEQINQRIAEACGWTEIKNCAWRHHKPWGYPPLKAGQGGNAFKMLPNYCDDLNAMHEAEKTLSETNMFVMAHWIEQNVSRHGQHYFHATARQRAEAFLRTIGKWEETQK